MERREIVERRAREPLEQCLHGGEHPALGGDVVGQLAVDLDDAVAQDEGGRRVPSHEGEPSPSLGALDRLEQEPGPIADEFQVGRNGCLQVGEEFGPDGDDTVG